MVDFKRDKYLYHYTSVESAIKIIVSNELKFSKMDKVNDINESNGPTWLCVNNEDCGKVNKVLRKYTQVSLTQDGEFKGYDISAMWGHYADKGNGACLVFEKKLFEREVKNRHQLYSDTVDYSVSFDPNDILYDSKEFKNVADFILAAKKSLFFHKSSDWKYEQEYRVIAIGNKVKPITVKESLVAVILFFRCHNEFYDSINYKLFSKITDLPLFRYENHLYAGKLYDSSGKEVDPIICDMAITKNLNAEEQFDII